MGDVFSEWIGTAGARAADGLRRDLERLPGSEVEKLRCAERETATHYVWRLVDEPADYFAIYVNEYKPADGVRGYARSIHDHRYDFCTTPLRGGYLHEVFDVEADARRQTHARARLVDERPLTVGQTLLVTTDVFHRVPKVEDETYTLLVKSRPRRPWSTSVDDDGTVRRHVPCGSDLRFRAFVAGLGARVPG